MMLYGRACLLCDSARFALSTSSTYLQAVASVAAFSQEEELLIMYRT